MNKSFLIVSVYVAIWSAGCARLATAADKKENAVPPAAEKTGKGSVSAPLAAIEKVQTAWDEAKTFQSSFKQVVFSKGLGTRDETEGMLYVSKPDRLRWEAKDGNLQILDNDVLWVVQPNRRRGGRVVDKWKKASTAVNAQLLSFIAGKAKLKDIYNIKALPAEGGGLMFRFEAKSADGESLIAKVDKKSYLLRSLTSESLDSRVILELGKIETNVSLKDSLFKFVPKKTDIVHEN